MNFSNKKLFILLGVAVVVLLIFAIIAKKMGWLRQGSVQEVTAVRAKRTTIVEKVSASGKIFPVTEVKISPQVSGEIIKIYFEEGDTVKKGDLILRINPNIYQSLLLQAEASLNQAKASLANAKARLMQINAQYENAKLTFERNKTLYERQAISQAEYDNAVAAFKTSEGEYEAAKQTVESAQYSVKSAEAALMQAKDNLEFTSVYAPIDGIISAMLVKNGERVVGTAQMAGTEMLRIADLNEMEVRVDVSENDILRISLHDTADIEVDAFIDRKFKGVVYQIANSATSTSNTFSLNTDQVTNFIVKIRLLKSSYEDLLQRAITPSPFKPGMSASVEIFTDKADNVVSVPIQCVTVREDDATGKKNEIVFRINDNKAHAVKVKTGIQDDRNIQIISGIEEGDEIISGPYRAISKLLKDGDAVKKISEEELLKREKKKATE
jgi:HlyD family secretion protein